MLANVCLWSVGFASKLAANNSQHPNQLPIKFFLSSMSTILISPQRVFSSCIQTHYAEYQGSWWSCVIKMVPRQSILTCWQIVTVVIQCVWIVELAHSVSEAWASATPELKCALKSGAGSIKDFEQLSQTIQIDLILADLVWEQVEVTVLSSYSELEEHHNLCWLDAKIEEDLQELKDIWSAMENLHVTKDAGLSRSGCWS